MSSSVKSVSDFGLYVTIRDLTAYAMANEEDVIDVGVNNGFNHYNEADGDCQTILDNDEGGLYFSVAESFFIAPLENTPKLFSPAYKNKEEALTELKENFSKFLPDDFDYEEKFVHYKGTVFG